MSYYDEDFYNLYNPQHGGHLENGLSFYKPNLIRQRGAGFGSWLLNIGRKLIPLAKKYILPHATSAVKNIANEVINNDVNLKESIKNNSIKALKSAGNQIINQSGSGNRKRKSLKRKKSNSKIIKNKKKPKLKHKNLFS